MKQVIWIGSSKKDVTAFPKRVKQTIGEALMFAQCGEKHPNAKPFKHLKGGGVWEIVEEGTGGTFRLVYTVRFAEAIIVLHAFQKKSKTGISTPKPELDLIESRLKRAKQVYEEG